ncbi:MAG: [LysW]-lysine hydrolase [Bacillota bacterium]
MRTDLWPAEAELWLLEQLCSIPSPSGQESHAVSFLVDYLRGLGWEAFVDEVGNGVGRVGKGHTRLLLLGHVDTVPGFIPVRREGDLIYARGAVDAKGPLATFVCAVERLKRSLEGEPLPLSITLVAAVGEETPWSPGAHHVVQTQAADMVIVGEPSGWDSVTVGYKGCLSFRATVRCACGHSAGPSPSAAERAVDFWRELKQGLNCFDGCAPGSTGAGRFWKVEPRLKCLDSCSDGMWDICSMEVCIRFPPRVDPEGLKAELLGLAVRLGEGVAIEFYPTVKGYLGDKHSPLTRAFTDSIRKLGVRPTLKLKCGTSDMNVVGPAWGVPVVAFGPGDSSLDHTPEEHLHLREYALAIQVLQGVLNHPLVTTKAS